LAAVEREDAQERYRLGECCSQDEQSSELVARFGLTQPRSGDAEPHAASASQASGAGEALTIAWKFHRNVNFYKPVIRPER
jgi:hypothetical protein